MPPSRVAVLVSGTGTNLAAMIKAGVPIALVLADRECPALDIAREAHIPVEMVDRLGWGFQLGSKDWDRKGFSEAVAQRLKMYNIDLVVMAGFMTIFHEVILEYYAARILNIHPAPLPGFPGEHAVKDVLAAGLSETHSTVHIATEVLDDHRYILATSKPTKIKADDTDDSLQDRMKLREWEVYSQTILRILEGEIDLDEVVASAA